MGQRIEDSGHWAAPERCVVVAPVGEDQKYLGLLRI
jgi:hypothetical protein